VGECIWRAVSAQGGSPTFKLKSHSNYLLTRALFSGSGVAVDLTGHKLGRSSWTLAFQIKVSGESWTVAAFLNRLVTTMGRPPFASPYWTELEWETLESKHNVSRTVLGEAWRKALPGMNWG
jgi:hypothetical protein